MKKRYYLLIASVAFISIFAVFRNDSKSFEKKDLSIEAELERWDPVRGVWLVKSLKAMTENSPIPDRMFPENVTPIQMISLLPNDLRLRVEHSFRIGDLKPTERTNKHKEREERSQTIARAIKPNCNTISARTYGDPHLVTFDGARYSFQTVGEFVLTRSHSGLEIQTRQKPEGEDFSLNTAVAMNVGGNRVGIYASDYHDANSSTPIRVNGQAIPIEADGNYFLPNGGVIRRTSNREYRVDWPTGESVVAELRSTQGIDFMNINVAVTECGSYNGLLGNANGIKSDDFGRLNDEASINIPEGSDTFIGTSREIEQSRLAYIANAMGDRFRVTHTNSLFDYPSGTSTETFTDRSFPRVHRTIEEIPESKQVAARKICEGSGVREENMNGCIYDQAYLELEPAPEPLIRNPTEGIILRPIQTPTPNVNSRPNPPVGSAGEVMETVHSTRPNLDQLDENRIPYDEHQTRKPKDEAPDDSRIRQEQIQEQYRLERERQEMEERDERKRIEQEEREEAAEADRRKREYERREREAENRETERRESEARERQEREERDERERIEREREREREKAEEEERERERAEKEEQRRKEEQAREQREREEREARKEREERAKAEAERKRAEQIRRQKEAAKKAREEAARKAKEEADRKRREEAVKKSRGGR